MNQKIDIAINKPGKTLLIQNLIIFNNLRAVLTSIIDFLST